MPIPLSQRPWLVRFAWFGVVVLFLLTPFVTYGLWCHLSGMAELQRVQERNAHEGRGSTIQDLLADIPDSDADRHERWWRWQSTVASHEPQIQKIFEIWDSDDARKWKLGLSADAPVPLKEAFDRVENPVTEVESLLHAGHFIAGMAGTFKSAFRPDDSVWLLHAANEFLYDGYDHRPDAFLHLLDLRAVQLATTALEYRTLAADSPASCSRALGGLDRLVEAFSHPVGLRETMFLLLAITRRDDAYMAAVLRRSLPEEEFTAWLADDRSSRSLRQVATAFRSERLVRIGFLIPLIHDGDLHRVEYYGRRVFTRLDCWLAGPAGLALCSNTMADIERRIEHGPGYVFDLGRWTRPATHNPVAHLIIPNLIEAGITAAELQFAARRTRVIALIVRNAMVSSSLPADMPELRTLLGTRASWLDSADDQCAMSYTRLATDRFRIAIDLTKGKNGDFTPFDRYRPSVPSPYRSTRSGGPPPPQRTDLPPKWSRMSDVEIWIPTELRSAPE